MSRGAGALVMLARERSLGSILPGDTKVQVTVQDLADVSALLSTFESENRRLAQAASKRIVADRAALAAIQELVEEVGAEVEQALPEMETSIEASQQQQQQQQQTQQQQGQGQPNDAPELRSTSQAHLWIQQARAVKEVLAREVGQQHPAVYSDNASVAAVFDAASVPGSDYCSAARVEPAHDILPTVAVQALEVACGLTRTFQQACQEGLESADKIIRQLYARQEQQSNGANNQRPARTEPPAQHQ
ncbi:Hypothetical Protein FCC1311_025972 [Hondaea fermentalgiana]|uniref:Uncharacterized protein n=1 Tax=Hondaea fermentalgiana TaxID=2315210 RepID=A0A2R5G5R5_9STRA|nr:Hypothetical Protein FCC1311_025972 [Hondaea fermentalgiana]|eukprot:GBG26376.1 Hypothetical Protein FCC1311_025972 [Hondaea fermentalgiana]